MNLSKELGKQAAAIVVLSCLVAPVQALGLDREHQVKTGFIFSIAKFCDWDFSKWPDNRFLIGVYRTKAYDLDIDVLNGRTIRGRKISVEQVKSEAEISGYHIIVVGDVGAESIKHLANLCRNTGTLIIGETESFAKDGGTVGLVVRDSNVKFQVNLQTAQLDHVVFPSKLLILAEQVYR